MKETTESREILEESLAALRTKEPLPPFALFDPVPVVNALTDSTTSYTQNTSEVGNERK